MFEKLFLFNIIQSFSGHPVLVLSKICSLLILLMYRQMIHNKLFKAEKH